MKRLLMTAISVLLAVCMLCGCGSSNAEATGTADISGSEAAASADNSAAQLIADIPTTQTFSDDPVSEEDIEKIVLAGVNAPSAMNSQPWHFTVITDKEVLQQISGGMSFGEKVPGTDEDAQEDMQRPDFMNRPEGITPPEVAGMPEEFTPPDGAGMPEGFTPPESAEKPEGFTPPQGMKLPGGAAAGGSKAGVADAPAAIVISCADGNQFDAGLACQNMSAEAQLLGYGTKILTSPTMTLNGANKAQFKALLGIPDGQSAVAVLIIGRAASREDAADAVSGATERNPLSETVTFVKP